LMLVWGPARGYLGVRGVRAYLAAVATVCGVFGAAFVFALKITPFLTVIAFSLFSMGFMILVGVFSPVNLNKPRRIVEVLQRVFELILIGVTLGPEYGWVETGVTVIALGAVLLVVGDDVQLLSEKSREVKDGDLETAAVTGAVDLFLSFFRLTLVFVQLMRPRKKR
jgi:peptidoglycan/LPS O-acetylase OafA/YrhL